MARGAAPRAGGDHPLDRLLPAEGEEPEGHGGAARRAPAARCRARIAELTTLPGVARKTANVVLGTAFGIAEGVVVDTHVQRLACGSALTRKTDPKGIEQDLMEVVPQDAGSASRIS